MRARYAWVVGIAVLTQFPLGCSSSSSPSATDQAAQPQVRGAYRASGDGSIQEINFYDATHYFLWRSPCADGQQPVPESTECREDGTYALNGDRTQLSLTNAATGQTTTLPFHAVTVDPSSTGESLAPHALHTQALAAGDGGLTNGDGGLTNDSGDGGLTHGDGGFSLYQLLGPLISAFEGGSQTFKADTQDGIDYAWARPAPADVRAAGYTFAARYLSHDSGKSLSADEATALATAGIDVVVTWETSAKRALSGRDAGVSDATDAQAQATAAGMPADRPIYFAVDFDGTEAQQDSINEYFDGAASVLGQGRTGAYGSYGVVSRLFDANKISWGWQTYAWSHGKWESRAQLRQIQNDAKVAGADCDLDQSQASDFGQWRPAGAPAQ